MEASGGSKRQVNACSLASLFWRQQLTTRRRRCFDANGGLPLRLRPWSVQREMMKARNLQTSSFSQVSKSTSASQPKKAARVCPCVVLALIIRKLITLFSRTSEYWSFFHSFFFFLGGGTLSCILCYKKANIRYKLNVRTTSIEYI